MTTTPLEQHRDANADASALAAISARIEASGVEAAQGRQALRASCCYHTEGAAKPRWARKPGTLSLSKPTAS
jgi:hypothetical protein